MAASNENISAAISTPEREVVITRVFNAPREVVFKAWTDPLQTAGWWGPKGFTNPVCEMNVRPGGALRIVMRGPDGSEYPMRGIFREIVRPERLVFTNIAEDREGRQLLKGITKVTFSEHGGKTKLVLETRMVGLVAGAAAMLAGMEQGWTQSLERLAEDLAGGTAGTSAREITATRIFDAPRKLVFKMWTDPEHLAKWWGPNGFTNTIYEMDVRPGGVWRFVMHGPNGVDYQNKNVYIEVVRPERLVYSHVSAPQFRMTAIFTDQGQKTQVDVRMLFESAAERDKVAQEFGAVEGLSQTLGRLTEYLQKSASNVDSTEFVIMRVFDAPRDLVFRAWTESERLKQWWGPKGFTWVSSKRDLRPGGVFHYCLRSPDGREMWGKFVYREIIPPERMVFINSFSDAEGNTVRHPFAPEWPLETLSTLTFTELNGKTALTLRGVPHGATEAERKAFEAGHKSMEQGFTGTLDQLAEYLAQA